MNAEGTLLVTFEEIALELRIGFPLSQEIIERPDFPRPVDLGDGKRRWMRQEVIDWLWTMPNSGIPNRVRRPEIPPELMDLAGRLREYELGDYRHCIYFLCQGDQLVYVGQAKYLPARIWKHLATPPAPFDRVLFMEVGPSAMNFTEALYIARLKPAANIAHTGRKRHHPATEGACDE